MAEHIYIGELSKRTGRSVHTIRWYESQGLMPGVIRDNGGRRLYSGLHLNWLDLMNRLRNTGMSIAEMRRYTKLVRDGKRSLRERRELLKAHREKVLDTISEWKSALKLIDKKINFYQEWAESGRRPTLDPTEALAQQEQNSNKRSLGSTLRRKQKRVNRRK